MNNRDATGKFLPGHQQPGPGRPTRQHEEEVLAAIRSSFPPDRIVAMLEEAYQIAKATNSARGIVAVVTDILDRTVGKPTPKPEEPKEDTYLTLLANLRANAEHRAALMANADRKAE